MISSHHLGNPDSVGALPGIWKHIGEEANLPEVAKVLDFKKKEVAAAARVPNNFSYHQDRLPPELQQRALEWARVLDLVASCFGGNAEQTAQWFRTPNYMLGGTEPRDMIRFGRASKLIQLIRDELA